jgi:hypothetical protein
MLFSSSLAALALVAGFVEGVFFFHLNRRLKLISLPISLSAHPGEVHEPRADLDAHRLRARAASKCSNHVSNLKARQLNKRVSSTLAKRNIPTSALSAASAQATGYVVVSFSSLDFFLSSNVRS